MIANMLHKYVIFHPVKSKTRNKESRINKVYLIYNFFGVLNSLLAEVSHGERD